MMRVMVDTVEQVSPNRYTVELVAFETLEQLRELVGRRLLIEVENP